MARVKGLYALFLPLRTENLLILQIIKLYLEQLPVLPVSAHDGRKNKSTTQTTETKR